MSITLGVYDIFTYAIPGAMYLTLITYVFTRLHWLDLTNLLNGNTTLIVLGAALACYLTGHVSYAAGRAVNRSIGVWKKDMDDAREEFARRVPAAKGRAFLQADRSTLQAAIEIHGMDPALEMIRLRAVALMLRNVVPALTLGAVVAIVESIHGDSPIFATSCAAILALAAIGSYWHAARMSFWANMKTLELAFWIPGIDDDLRASSNQDTRTLPSPRQPRSPKPRRTPGSTDSDTTGSPRL